MIIDTKPGQVTIRDAESILGDSDVRSLDPDATRELADRLETEGKHTVAAEGLRRAADRAETMIPAPIYPRS